jgi:hypothetical protein
MFAYRVVLMIMLFLRVFAGIRRFVLHPRLQLVFFALLALALQGVILLFSPAQSPVVLYKLALVVIAAILAVFCDVAVFPFARPDSYLALDWRNDPDADRPGEADYPIADGYEGAFCAACLRRALIIAAFVLAVSLGL